MTNWAELDPMTQIGGITHGVSTDVSTGGLSSAQTAAKMSVTSLDHPLMIFAVVAAATFGLIGASTHLRAGPFKLSAQGGKT